MIPIKRTIVMENNTVLGLMNTGETVLMVGVVMEDVGMEVAEMEGAETGDAVMEGAVEM